MSTTNYIDQLNTLVETELKAIVNERAFPLYNMMAYHLGWQEAHSLTEALPLEQERTHGILTLLSCAAVGGSVGDCLPASAAIELVDKFAEIHDDVQEGNPQRNRRDAVWWVWGPAQAINTGDGMHALGRLALLRLRNLEVTDQRVLEVVRMVDRASLRACEGRFRDLEAQERIDLTIEAYLNLASDKRGALLSCALQTGAIIGGADRDTADALAKCGEELGIALQIQSDLRAIWTDDGDAQRSLEVLNKKKLLPVVYALENASISEKRALGEIYFKRVLEADDAVKLRGVLENLGAREACEVMAESHLSEALKAIDCLDVAGEDKTRMVEYVEELGSVR